MEYARKWFLLGICVTCNILIARGIPCFRWNDDAASILIIIDLTLFVELGFVFSSLFFQILRDSEMRAEIQSIVDDIKQSMALLRRHL